MSGGFTFAGDHSDDHSLKVLGVRRSILPSIRDTYQRIPGRPGSYVFPEELGDRVVTVEAGLVGSSPGNLVALERDVAEWLWTRGRETLIFDDDPEWYFRAKVASPMQVGDALDLGAFEIEFQAEPYVYALDESSASCSMGASVTFESDYAPDVPPRIVVYSTGTLTNPSVTLGGETIAYEGEIDGGAAVVWDGVDFWSLLFPNDGSGVAVRDGAFDPTLGTPVEPLGDFPTITQGTVTVTTEAESGTGTVVIYWRPRRL